MDGRRKEAQLEIREVLKALPALLLLAACSESGPPPAQRPEAKQAQPPRTAPAPREAGGLPDDGTPLTEAPAKPGGAQEAATVVETYYALIEAGKYEQAWKLRWTRAGDSSAAFVDSFGRYASYHASVGAPSQPQEAGGSFYVEVPVQIYGRLKTGEPFSSAGNVTLRGKAGERQWRIYS